jgi:Tfp pilus assembly protein PilO
MNVRFTPRVLAVIAAAVIGLIVVVGWYAGVSPQRSKAKSLDAQIAEEQSRLTVAQLLARSQKADKGKTTGIGLLGRAMPASLQMPTILRQVQALAAGSHVSVVTFTPSGATPLAGYDAVPIDLSVTGRYAAVEKFLHKLRVQAGSTGGRIKATGRLFDVQTVALTPGGAESSELSAAIHLATFIYTGVPLPAAAPTTTTTEGDTGTAASAPPAEGGST